MHRAYYSLHIVQYEKRKNCTQDTVNNVHLQGANLLLLWCSSKLRAVMKNRYMYISRIKKSRGKVGDEKNKTRTKYYYKFRLDPTGFNNSAKQYTPLYRHKMQLKIKFLIRHYLLINKYYLFSRSLAILLFKPRFLFIIDKR